MDGVCFSPDGSYTIEGLDPEAELPFSLQWYDFLRGSDKYWSRRKFMRPGETVTPSKIALNGHRYMATVGGTTGINEPAIWAAADNAEVIDGGVTWTEIGAEDKVLESEWDAGGLTATNPIIDATGCVTAVVLAGLTAGHRYRVKNSIVTVDGKHQDQSFTVIVKPN